MSARPIHVYRLEVVYPEGSQEPGWEPENYAEIWERLNPDYTSDPNYDGPIWPFAWPRAKTYLGAAGANKRADMIRAYGAKVEVRRSLPVEWPEVPA